MIIETEAQRKLINHIIKYNIFRSNYMIIKEKFEMNCNCSRCSILNLFNKVSETVKLQEKLDSDNVIFSDRLKIKERLSQLKTEIESINVPVPQMWASKINPIFN